MPRRLFLDTSVWRNAAGDRAWLRRIASAGAAVVATEEVVEELVVSALSAASPATYEEVRVACRLVERYATEVLPPFEYVLARELGIADLCAPDPRAACQFIADCHTRDEARSRATGEIPCGPGHTASIERWRSLMDSRKRAWRASLTRALEKSAPDIVSARQRGATQSIDRETLHRLRAQLLADQRALGEIEIARVENLLQGAGAQLRDRDGAVTSALSRLQPFVKVLTEVLIDRFDHPENASRRKAKLEGNDAYDVAQLRNLRADDIWVTDDVVWPQLATTDGIAGRVMAPANIDPALLYGWVTATRAGGWSRCPGSRG